jgi:cell division protein FtsW
VLPDAHADFVFAVAGEEFGLIVCLLLVALFAFVVLRGFARAGRGQRHVHHAGATGPLPPQFGLQAIVNMASTCTSCRPRA